MVLAPTTEIIPLTADAHGVLRIGNTRVTLDTVLAAFVPTAPPPKKSSSNIRHSRWRMSIPSLATTYDTPLKLMCTSNNVTNSGRPCGNRMKRGLIRTGSGNGYWHAAPVVGSNHALAGCRRELQR